MTDFRTASRFKDWYVPEHLMAAAVAAFVTGKCPCQMTSDLNLPDGVEVVGVFHDFYRKAFVVRLRHESFEPVPDGSEVPGVVYSIKIRESPSNDPDTPTLVGR